MVARDRSATSEFDLTVAAFVPPDQRFLSRRFSEALVLAAELHAGQRRKGGQVPFVSHLLAVSAIALEYGASEDEASAALLHDAIEDAPPTLGADGVRRLIADRFGAAVLSIVEGCTDTDQAVKPRWRARKEAYIARLATAGPSVLLVSAADKLHNVRAIVRDYLGEGDAVFDRFTRDAGKAGTIGYYRGLTDVYLRRRTDGAGRFAELADALHGVVSELERRTGTVGRWPPD